MWPDGSAHLRLLWCAELLANISKIWRAFTEPLRWKVELSSPAFEAVCGADHTMCDPLPPRWTAGPEGLWCVCQSLSLFCCSGSGHLPLSSPVFPWLESEEETGDGSFLLKRQKEWTCAAGGWDEPDSSAQNTLTAQHRSCSLKAFKTFWFWFPVMYCDLSVAGCQQNLLGCMFMLGRRQNTRWCYNPNLTLTSPRGLSVLADFYPVEGRGLDQGQGLGLGLDLGQGSVLSVLADFYPVEGGFFTSVSQGVMMMMVDESSRFFVCFELKKWD